MEDEAGMSPVLAPKKQDIPKEEQVEDSPVKPTPTGTAKGVSPASKASKGKRKLNGDDNKVPNSAPSKKAKAEVVRHFLHPC